MTSISIPNSVTSIGRNAFAYCTSLTSVTVEWETPISLNSSNTFSNASNATLYVPKGTKAAYEVADYWKNFKEIVEYDTNPDEPGTTQTVLSVGNALASFQPNTWYFVHQGRESTSQSAGSYSYCPVGEKPTTGGFITEMGESQQVKKMSINNVEDNSAFSIVAPYLVRFVPVEGHTGAYHIQFGTGNWMCAPASQGNSRGMATTADSSAAGTFNVYAIPDNDNPGYFALNICDSRGDYQELIDNNGNNAVIVTWSSGMKTTATGNSVWSIVEVEYSEIDEKQAVANELEALADQYDAMMSTLRAKEGSTPGFYDVEKVNALAGLIEDAYEATGSAYSTTTVSEMQALIEALRQTYEAAIIKIPVTLADGYYRIKGGLRFYQDGVYLDKYLLSTEGEGVINARWDTPELNSDATALWEISNRNGYFDIVNVATQARFNNVVMSTPVTMSTTTDNLMALDPVYTDAVGTTYCNIRVSTQTANDYLYLHMDGHSNGTGTRGNIVGWSSSWNGSSAGATEWVFMPVTAEEAQAVIEADLFLARYESLLTDARNSLAEAKDLQYTSLIQNVSQLSSPYTETSEGSLAALIDGNTSTYWHSNWRSGSVAGGIHYLQADLIEQANMDVYLTFTRRQTGNDHVTNMSVFGTNDYSAEKSACEELLTFDCPYTNYDETITSLPFSTKGYRYLRLYANTTNKNRGYWHMAELQIYGGTLGPNEYITLVATEADNLQFVIDAQALLSRGDIGEDEYNELKEAYDAFLDKVFRLTHTVVDVQDGVAYNLDSDTETDRITYTRNFTNTGWQALYVPFEMQYEDWKDDFEVSRINNVNQYDDDEDGNVDRTILEVFKVKSGHTEAHTPYLIRVNEIGEKTITVTNTTLYAAEERSYDVSSWNTLYTFTGTYTGVSGATMFSEGYYALGSGSLHQAADATNSLNPMRWYMAVTDRDGNPKNLGEVKVVVFGMDEDELIETGLEEVGRDALSTNDGAVYDLNGRRVTNPRKGLYIKNGKKFVIK